MNERKHWIYVLLLLVIPSQTAVFLFQWVSDKIGLFYQLLRAKSMMTLALTKINEVKNAKQ